MIEGLGKLCEKPPAFSLWLKMQFPKYLTTLCTEVSTEPATAFWSIACSLCEKTSCIPVVKKINY
jgi:hypothetical protein